jgi:hypothetical protein
MDEIQTINMNALKTLCKAYDIKPAEKKAEDELVEKLAALEHEQWMQWSKNIVDTEFISLKRRQRWFKLWCHYDELSEEMKEFDRLWARKVLDVLNENQEMNGSTVSTLIQDIESATARIKALTLDSLEEHLKALVGDTPEEEKSGVDETADFLGIVKEVLILHKYGMGLLEIAELTGFSADAMRDIIKEYEDK